MKILESNIGSSVLGTNTESRAIYSLFCFLPSPQLIGLLIDNVKHFVIGTGSIFWQDRNAVVFAFDVHPRYNEKLDNIKLQGLNSKATYSVREINRAYCASDNNPKTYSGQYLMTVGLPLFTNNDLSSRIYELNQQ